MKIFFVITQLGGGGAERVVSLLSEYFAANGHTVAVICTSFNGSRSYRVNDSVEVISLVNKKENFLGKAKKLKKILYKEKPDIVISFLPNSGFLVYLASASKISKIVSSERNSPSDSPSSSILRILRRFVFKHSDMIVFQSDGAKNYFSKIIQSKGVVIANPIVFDRLPVAKPILKRFVSVGRITEQKNYPVLIKAFNLFHSIYPEYTLSIFGRDYSSGAIDKLIKEMKLDSFVFRRDFSDSVWDEVAKSSAYCLSSDFEGMPNALLEASAIGLPVISTDYRPGGAGEIVNHGNNGLLVPAGNVVAYADAMCKIVEDIEGYSHRALIFRDAIRQKFDISIIGKQWINLFDFLIKK